MIQTERNGTERKQSFLLTPTVHMHGLCMHQVYSTCSLVLYYSSQDQKTALHYASVRGHHDTVRVLLEKGADPNTCDKVSGM